MWRALQLARYCDLCKDIWYWFRFWRVPIQYSFSLKTTLLLGHLLGCRTTDYWCAGQTTCRHCPYSDNLRHRSGQVGTPWQPRHQVIDSFTLVFLTREWFGPVWLLWAEESTLSFELNRAHPLACLKNDLKACLLDNLPLTFSAESGDCTQTRAGNMPGPVCTVLHHRDRLFVVLVI